MKSLFTPNPGLEKAHYCVIPVPFDGTASYGKGTAKGPDRIFAAAKHVELFDEKLKTNLDFNAVHTMRPVQDKNARDIVALVRERTVQVLSLGKTPVLVGGEHSVSEGAILACKERYNDLAVLHLDAHLDLRHELDGEEHSHATVMRRVHEYGIRLVSAGVRSICDEEYEFITKHTIPVFWAEELLNGKKNTNDVLRCLKGNVYISVDADVFDASLMPATGTPEPGGLFWQHVLPLVIETMRTKKVIGFDLTELAPIHGLRSCDYTAAKLLLKMIHYHAST